MSVIEPDGEQRSDKGITNITYWPIVRQSRSNVSEIPYPGLVPYLSCLHNRISLFTYILIKGKCVISKWPEWVRIAGYCMGVFVGTVSVI